MLKNKLHMYNMSSATKLIVMMSYGDAAARLTNKVKRAKGIKAPL